MIKRTSLATAAAALVVAAAILANELEIWAFQSFHSGSSPAMVPRIITYLGGLLVVGLAYVCAKEKSNRRLVAWAALVVAMVAFAGTVVTVGFNPSEGVLTVKWMGATAQVQSLPDANDIVYCFNPSSMRIDVTSSNRRAGAFLYVGPWLGLFGSSSLDSALAPLTRCSASQR